MRNPRQASPTVFFFYIFLERFFYLKILFNLAVLFICSSVLVIDSFIRLKNPVLVPDFFFEKTGKHFFIQIEFSIFASLTN